jgi:hypothetical protein
MGYDCPKEDIDMHYGLLGVLELVSKTPIDHKDILDVMNIVAYSLI